MIEDIVKAVRDHHMATITTAVQADPQLEKIREATLQYLKENYGKMVMQAMVHWMASHMDNMGYQVEKAVEDVHRIDNDVQAITQRLLQQQP